MISNKLIQAAAGNAAGGAISPIGVSFDGANDYLSRSSDLTNNSDSKTCTFSAWVYLVVTGEQQMLYSTDSGDSGFKIYLQTNRLLGIEAFDASSRALQAQNSIQIPVATWTHILVSMDMANTSNRHVYINDIADGSVSWYTYNDKTIDFTRSTHKVGFEGSARYVKGRLAGVFLDYTFRNLATASNRRLFIDEDGLYIAPPTTGIISLPLESADTATTNAGTGGNFTLNGVVATADRGPNQINCSASEFDGSNDNLTRTSLTNAASSKTQTISVNFRTDTNGFTYMFYATASNGDQVGRFNITNTYQIQVYLNAGLQVKLNYPVIVIGKQYSFQISFDLSDSSKRKAFLNGIDVTSNLNFITYNNNTIPFANVNSISVGGAGQKHNGSMGEFYFSTLYTDMSSENPFFDSDTNLPKPLKTVIEETGVTPVIALPLNGNNAGKNLGYGGDFTVNSGPYTGVRGASEFVAKSIQATGNAQLENTSYVGPSTKTFTLAFAGKRSSNQNLPVFTSGATVGSTDFRLEYDYGRRSYKGEAYNSSGTRILVWEVGYNTSPNQDQWYIMLVSMDLANTSKRHIYLDGVSKTGDFGTYTNDSIDMTKGAARIAGDANHQTGFFYLSSAYTDLSQEANRNKFVDQLGFPRDLGDDGSEPSGSSPLIYMKFDNIVDSDAVGTNRGTGGNFSKAGSGGDANRILSGPDVTN